MPTATTEWSAKHFVGSIASSAGPRRTALSGELPPEEAAHAYEQTIHETVPADETGNSSVRHDPAGDGRRWPHGQFFPGSQALNVTDRLVVADYVSKFGAYRRLTFTYPLLNAGCHVVILVSGASIVPEFYDHPSVWTGRMRSAIVSCGPQFSMRRMLAEYTRTLYAPNGEEAMMPSAEQQQLVALQSVADASDYAHASRTRTRST